MVAINQSTIQGFSRLSRVFRSGIRFSSATQIVATAKNKIVGNLPKDLLNLVIKSNPKNKGQVIKNVQEVFEETAINLAKLEKAEEEALSRFVPSLENVLKMFGPNKRLLDDSILKKKMAEIIASAEKKMLTKLKKEIPELDNVKISFVGEGSFGITCKCEFLDANGRRIISDKVIKSFRESSDYHIRLFGQMDEALSKYSNSEIVEFAETKGQVLSKSEVEAFRFQLKTMLGNFDEELSATERKYHGAIAEANASEFIRFFQGHKTKTTEGILIPDMISLGEHPWQISEYIGNAHTPSKKLFNFERLGLIHSDSSAGNRINNICIDLGGVKPIASQIKGKPWAWTKEELICALTEADNSHILGDKFLMKKLKKFFSLRTKEEKLLYLQQLEEEAIITRNALEKDKIKQFIREVKDKYEAYLPAPEIIAEEIPVTASDVSGNVAKELFLLG